MYADPSSPYYANNRIHRYRASSIYENVTTAFAILKATEGNLEQAVLIGAKRGRDADCTAASAGALAGVLTGTTTISRGWFEVLEEGLRDDPCSNSRSTNQAGADAIHGAPRNKLRRMKKKLQVEAEKQGGQLPEKLAKQK